VILSSRDAACFVFYSCRSSVKFTVLSESGKEAIIEILGVDDFVSASCTVGQPLWMTSASALTPWILVRVGKHQITELLHTERVLLDRSMAHHIPRMNQDLWFACLVKKPWQR
jgi:CRP/FNR family transcriptional regulator, cyclic AMP receptor protein